MNSQTLHRSCASVPPEEKATALGPVDLPQRRASTAEQLTSSPRLRFQAATQTSPIPSRQALSVPHAGTDQAPSPASSLSDLPALTLWCESSQTQQQKALGAEGCLPVLSPGSKLHPRAGGSVLGSLIWGRESSEGDREKEHPQKRQGPLGPSDPSGSPTVTKCPAQRGGIRTVVPPAQPPRRVASHEDNERPRICPFRASRFPP